MTDLNVYQPQAATADNQPSKPRFDGKVILITGASDRGIGGAIAERVAREGASVWMISRAEPQRLLKQLRRLDCNAEWVYGDITQPDDIRQSVDACIDQFGRVDVLVNNAGVEFARSFSQMSDSQWRELLDVNLTGTIAMTRAVLPHLVAPGAAIISIASALAIGGCPGFSIYSASKAALIGFTQSLAWELAPQKIRVVCVAPGLVETPMTFKHIARRTKEVQSRIDACHPLGTGSPHDVASAVAFLASEDARWITGVTLPLGWAPHYPLPVDHFMDS